MAEKAAVQQRSTLNRSAAEEKKNLPLSFHSERMEAAVKVGSYGRRDRRTAQIFEKNQQMFGETLQGKETGEKVHASITRENVRRGCDPRQPAGKLKAQHGNFRMLKDAMVCDRGCVREQGHGS